jgi:hypothetical protein
MFKAVLISCTFACGHRRRIVALGRGPSGDVAAAVETPARRQSLKPRLLTAERTLDGPQRGPGAGPRLERRPPKRTRDQHNRERRDNDKLPRRTYSSRLFGRRARPLDFQCSTWLQLLGEREHPSQCLTGLDHLPAAFAVTHVTVRRRQGEDGQGAHAFDRRPPPPWLARAATGRRAPVPSPSSIGFSRDAHFISGLMAHKTPFLVADLGPNVEPFLAAPVRRPYREGAGGHLSANEGRPPPPQPPTA